MAKILSYGEIIWDIYPSEKHIGGASLNFAAHLARLGNESYLLSALGNDLLKAETINEISGFGVMCDKIQTNSHVTGVCNVTLDDKGKPNFRIRSDVAYDHIAPSIFGEKYDLIYFGTLIQRSEVSLQTLKQTLNDNSFGEIFCDINIRKDCCSVNALQFCLENSTILKISRDEEIVLIEMGILPDSNISDCVERYKYFGRYLCGLYPNIKIVLFTLDSDGATVYDKNTDVCLYRESIKVKVVSTVGAGDSFSAGFVDRYLAGRSIEECLDFAVKLSSYVVSVYEAVPDYEGWTK